MKESKGMQLQCIMIPMMQVLYASCYAPYTYTHICTKWICTAIDMNTTKCTSEEHKQQLNFSMAQREGVK